MHCNIYLVTHAGDNRCIPIGGQACNRFQGKRTCWSNKRDHIVLETHVGCQTGS